MDDQSSLYRDPPCFGRHVKPLVLAAFAVVSTPTLVSRRIDARQVAGRKKIAQSLSQQDKDMLYRPHYV
jgi:hypothetical protein